MLECILNRSAIMFLGITAPGNNAAWIAAYTKAANIGLGRGE